MAREKGKVYINTNTIVFQDCMYVINMYNRLGVVVATRVLNRLSKVRGYKYWELIVITDFIRQEILK